MRKVNEMLSNKILSTKVVEPGKLERVQQPLSESFEVSSLDSSLSCLR
jgi:hypothetical protein